MEPTPLSSDFGLILHTGYIIDGDKRLRVLAVDKAHQLLIFAFIHDGDDLVMLFKVICANGLVYCSAAVQIVDDKLTERLFLFCDNADAALFIIVEDEIIQNDSVKVCAKDAQNHRLFIVNQGS